MLNNIKLTLEITQLSTINEETANQLAALSIQLGYATTASDLAQRTHQILLSNQDCLFVCRKEGKIIAWIHAFIAVRVESSLFVEIASLIVDENHRKLQIAKKLIDEVASWSRTQHIDKLTVRCNALRLNTHQFYQHLGFKLKKQQKIFEIEL